MMRLGEFTPEEASPPQAGEKPGCCCLLCVSLRMQVPDVGMETAGAVALSNF